MIRSIGGPPSLPAYEPGTTAADGAKLATTNGAVDNAIDGTMNGKTIGAPGGGQSLENVFTQFVGQTLFGQMLSSMRDTQEKPAYFHGGRAEEIFQSQLDQVLVEELTAASGDSIAGPMFDLFQRGTKQ
jgi:peptidoglycan hydrolase FlgJ